MVKFLDKSTSPLLCVWYNFMSLVQRGLSSESWNMTWISVFSITVWFCMIQLLFVSSTVFISTIIKYKNISYIVKCLMTCIRFFKVSVKNYRKLGRLKQQFWRLKVQNKGVSRALFLLESVGESCLAFPSY